MHMIGMPSLSHVTRLSMMKKSHLTVYMTRNCTQKNAAVSFILMASSANLVLAGKSRMSRMPAALVLPCEDFLGAVVAEPHA